MFYFTIVRHGQTTSNFQDIIHSGDGGQLTEKGIQMAKTLGKHLQNEKFTKVYASDYTRAQDTANYILSQLKTPTPKVIPEPLLRERFIGDWEKKNFSLITKKLKELGLPIYRVHTLDVPGCESIEDCKKRCGKFFTNICKLVDETKDGETENVLAISHSWYIYAFVDYLVENPSLYQIANLNEKDMKVNTENTCRTRFSIGKKDANGKRTLTFSHIFDISHLKSLAS